MTHRSGADMENDAQQVLYDIGGQFDSGEMDRTWAARRFPQCVWCAGMGAHGMGKIQAW